MGKSSNTFVRIDICGIKLIHLLVVISVGNRNMGDTFVGIDIFGIKLIMHLLTLTPVRKTLIQLLLLTSVGHSLNAVVNG